MLKIERTSNGRVVLTLSGRIEIEDLSELQRLLDLESSDQQIVLNLRDVTLVDRDAVKFLVGCQAKGIQFENCPSYVNEWIEQERAGLRRSKVSQRPSTKRNQE